MPAKKKKGGKKGGKKDAGEDDGGPIDPAAAAKMLVMENTALQLKLAERQQEASRAVASKRELLQRLEELKGDFEKEQETTQDITASMTLQYKSMQEGLMNRINTLERTIMDLKDQLDFARMALEETKREKEEALAAKDEEIAEMRQKMDEMANEFGDMLKQTLDRMNERIEVSNTSWEKETGVPIIKKLEEFNLGK